MPNIFLLSFLLVLSGCYSSDYVSFNSTTYPETFSCEVLEDLASCKYEFVIFGMIQKKARTVLTSPQGAIESLINDAKEKGADCITDISIGTNRISNPGLLYQNIDVVSAKLVRYMRDVNGQLILKQK